MPLMLLVPPSTRPRGIASTRPSSCGWGTERYCQSTSLPQSLKYSTGVWMKGWSSAPPASIRATVTSGTSESLRASAQPDEPAPTIT